MELKTLGGARLDGHRFSGQKSLTLLAYLALEGPKARSFVAELFWRNSADPLNRLSSTLSRLRDVDTGLFDTDGRRVWTDVPVDVRRLLRAAEREDHDAVIDLYSGPFLGRDVVDGSVELEEWILAKREFLADVARSSLLATAQTEAAQGRFYVAAKLAERALRLESSAPADSEDFETAYSLLLAGDHAFAKEVRRDAPVDVEALPETATAARERLGRLSDTTSGRVSQRTARPFPTNEGAFLGRDEEIERAQALLAEPSCRLLSLVGPGGIGKTRLAVEIVAHVEQRWSDGACFVSLASVTDPGLVADAVADCLGIPLADRDRETQLLRSLRARSMLLVLDNFEHLLEARGLIARIVREAPGVDVLVTTRERLGLRSEWVFPLEGLAYPGASAPLPSEPRDPMYGALDLFEQAARKVQRDFRLDRDSLSGVLRICRAVGGMPLALELAAGWLGVLPLEDIAAEVERGVDMLETDAEDVPPRHRSMRDLLAASWTTLSEEDRPAAAALTVFAGPFARDAAEFVSEVDARALRRLVSRSFVRRQGDRYSMHELLRQFAAEKLYGDSAVARRVEHRHATHFLGVLEGAMLRFEGPEQRASIAKILQDLPDVLIAWRRAWSNGWWDEVSRGAAALSVLLHHSSRNREGADAFAHALAHLEAAADVLPEETQLSVLAAFSSFQATAGARLEEAEEAAVEAVRRYEAAGERLVLDPMCHPYFAATKMALVRGEYVLAKRRAEAYLEAVADTHPGRGPVCAHAFVAIACESLGEVEEAGEHYRAGYALALETREDLHAENYTDLLGGHALAKGNLEEAEAYFGACLSIGERHDLPVKRMEALKGLYEVSLHRSDVDEAERRLARARPLAERLGFARVLAWNELAAAEIHLHRGRVVEAAACVSDAVALVWTGRPGRDLSPVFATASDVFERLGSIELSRRLLRWLVTHPASRPRDRALARRRLGGAEEGVREPEDTARLVRDVRQTIEALRIVRTASGP